MQKELQDRLDELIKDCGNEYKISDGKIVATPEVVVANFDVVYNVRYVGEVGWLYRDIEGDIKLDGIDQVFEDVPKSFIIENRRLKYNDVALPISFPGFPHELGMDVYKFDLDEETTDGEILYVLDTSDCKVDEYEEYCLSEHPEVLLYKTRDVKKYEVTESTY